MAAVLKADFSLHLARYKTMGHQYAAIAFTDTVKQVQHEQDSREAYTGMEQGEDFNHLLSQREANFIQQSDSFYMASVSETGWPYVQHRGGPKGFMRVLDEKTLGFADFSGNRQYISTGNFRNNDRVSIFLWTTPTEHA
jgi:predicted pyridoxine 5'-phosphate oxidase superfamily flavin-nucleotide-binding protein